MRRTRRSDPGTVCRTGPITSRVTRWWRRWTKSASTARYSSLVFHVPLRRQLCGGSAAGPSGPVRHRQAGRPGRSGSGRCRRRVEADAGRGRGAYHGAEGGRARPNDPGLDRILRRRRHDFPVNILCWGNLEPAPRCRSPSRHAIHHRPSGHPAAARAARAATALGRPPEGAGTRQAPERGDQGQRRLHAVAGAVSVSRTFGTRWPACSMPGVSIAACGAPTGRARSPSSTTSRPSSRFFAPTA